MSRADKRHHRHHIVGTSNDTSVRLFAFSNTRPAYRVVFSPDAPLILLKASPSAPNAHPCAAWSPLARLLFEWRPNAAHALYLLDAANPPALVRREEAVGASAGPLARRVANVLARLNPRGATLCAVGAAAGLALKCALGTDVRVGRVVLALPPAEAARCALAAPRRRDGPKPKLHLIVDKRADADALLGAACWEELFAAVDVEAVDGRAELFAAVARAAGFRPDGTPRCPHTRFDAPRVYRIDFVLSKDTKKSEQLVTLCPLDTAGDGAATNQSDEERSEGNGDGSGTEDGGRRGKATNGGGDEQ